MIRWSKMRAVASFEFTSMVTRKGYLIATFGMPLFVLAYGGLISTIGMFVESKESEVRIWGVVDRSGVLRLAGDTEVAGIEVPEEVRQALEARGQQHLMDQALAWTGNAIFRPLAGDDEAREALARRDIRGWFVLHEDYLASGLVEQFLPDETNLMEGDARRALGDLLLERMLHGRLEPDIATRVSEPIAETAKWTVKADGTVEERTVFAIVAKLVVPLAFSVLFFISLMMSSGYLVQGTAQEKENKVVEVLLSSANPDEVLTGKLLGLGAAGLLQVAVWFGMVIVGGLATATAMSAVGIEVPWGAIAAAFVFFVFGYLFLGSLMLGVGSLGNNQRESQQFTMVLTLPTIVPLVFMGVLITDPHVMAAKIMTWIPFTAPITVILRMTLEPAGIAWWEIVGSLAVLAVSTWFAIRLGARLFRVGLMLSGARPKWRAILRQARLRA